MKYSAVPQTDGKIVMWQIDKLEMVGQFPYLPVKRNERVTIEADIDDQLFCAAIVDCSGQRTWLPFTPDTPPILHRGKGGLDVSILGDEALKSYERFRQEIRERRIRDRSKK